MICICHTQQQASANPRPRVPPRSDHHSDAPHRPRACWSKELKALFTLGQTGSSQNRNSDICSSISVFLLSLFCHFSFDYLISHASRIPRDRPFWIKVYIAEAVSFRKYGKQMMYVIIISLQTSRDKIIISSFELTYKLIKIAVGVEKDAEQRELALKTIVPAKTKHLHHLFSFLFIHISNTFFQPRFFSLSHVSHRDRKSKNNTVLNYLFAPCDKLW